MSKETIISALPESLVRMMRDWAIVGASVGVCPISSAYEGGRIHGNTYGPSVPLRQCTATELDFALDRLPERERLAVKLFWIYEGQDLVWLGRRLHCDYRAVERRVRKGHELLRNELARLERRREIREGTYAPGVIV